MKYYSVPLIGVGTDPDPIRPTLADDLSWVGQPHTDATYLVAVPDDSPITPTRDIIAITDAELDAEATRRGQRATDVRRWHVRSRALRDDEIDPDAPTRTRGEPTTDPDPTRTRG